MITKVDRGVRPYKVKNVAKVKKFKDGGAVEKDEFDTIEGVRGAKSLVRKGLSGDDIRDKYAFPIAEKQLRRGELWDQTTPKGKEENRKIKKLVETSVDREFDDRRKKYSKD